MTIERNPRPSSKFKSIAELTISKSTASEKYDATEMSSSKAKPSFSKLISTASEKIGAVETSNSINLDATALKQRSQQFAHLCHSQIQILILLSNFIFNTLGNSIIIVDSDEDDDDFHMFRGRFISRSSSLVPRHNGFNEDYKIGDVTVQTKIIWVVSYQHLVGRDSLGRVARWAALKDLTWGDQRAKSQVLSMRWEDMTQLRSTLSTLLTYGCSNDNAHKDHLWVYNPPPKRIYLVLQLRVRNIALQSVFF